MTKLETFWLAKELKDFFLERPLFASGIVDMNDDLYTQVALQAKAMLRNQQDVYPDK